MNKGLLSFMTMVLPVALVVGIFSPYNTHAAPGDRKWVSPVSYAPSIFMPAIVGDSVYASSYDDALLKIPLDSIPTPPHHLTHSSYPLIANPGPDSVVFDALGPVSPDSNGVVYTGVTESIPGVFGFKTYLRAVNPDGSFKWTTTATYSGLPATIGPDSTIYVWLGNSLCALSPDGNIKWEYRYSSTPTTPPAVDDNGDIYVVVDDMALHATDRNGMKKWECRINLLSPHAMSMLGLSFLSSPALGPDGTVYIGSPDDHLYAVAADGTLKWKYAAGGPILSSPAVGTDATIYVGSDDMKLHAVNPDGTPKWTFTTGGKVRSSPSLTKDGSVYFCSADQYLRVLDASGNLKWQYRIGHPTGDISKDTMPGGPLIAADGTVIVWDANATIHAVEGTPGGSAWTMFRTPARSIAPVSTPDFTADAEQRPGTVVSLGADTATPDTTAALRGNYSGTAGYTPVESTRHFSATVAPQPANATFSFKTSLLQGGLTELGLYTLRNNGTVPFIRTDSTPPKFRDGDWWVTMDGNATPMGAESMLIKGAAYRIHFTVKDNGNHDINATAGKLNGRVTLGRPTASLSPETPAGVQVSINNSTSVPKDATDLVTTYGRGGQGITPVSDMIEFHAAVSPTNSLAVFRFNSTKLQGKLNTMVPRKFFNADLSFRDYGSYLSSGAPAEGNWWITLRNNTRLAPGETLVKGTNYYINLAILDNGLYDADPTPGRIADPVILAQTPPAATSFTESGSAVSSESRNADSTSDSATAALSSGPNSSTGCMMNPTADFGMEWLMLLLSPLLGLIRVKCRPLRHYFLN